MAAPDGNTNSKRGRDWYDAIRYVVAERGRDEPGDEVAVKKGLRKVAQKFVDAAENGEQWAMKELGDRIDGRATQAVELSGENGTPIQHQVDWTILPVVPIDRADEADTETK